MVHTYIFTYLFPQRYIKIERFITKLNVDSYRYMQLQKYAPKLNSEYVLGTKIGVDIVLYVCSVCKVWLFIIQ